MTSTATGSLGTEMVSIDALRPDPANPRSISSGELDALERSIRTFGFVQPVIARRADGIVIGGHQRLTAARRLGLASVPVIWLDLPAEGARLLGLALNRIAGTWDEQLLARLLAELKSEPRRRYQPVGLRPRRDRRPAAQPRGSREARAARELRSRHGPRRGPPERASGAWLSLGAGRAPPLCGDATKPADVERLLGGGRADMAFCDGPYNVALGDHGGRGPAPAGVARSPTTTSRPRPSRRSCGPGRVRCWRRSMARSTYA